MGGPRGRAAAQGGPLGAHLGALVDYTNVNKNQCKNVYLRLRGVPGGRPGKTPKTAAWVGKVVQNGGVPNGAARGPGPPPGAPRGLQKGCHRLSFSVLGPFWTTRPSKCVVFHRFYRGFQKAAKNQPRSVGHPFFRRSWGALGGPGPPLGISGRFLGGPWAP